jgi:hypothetical protein
MLWIDYVRKNTLQGWLLSVLAVGKREIYSCLVVFPLEQKFITNILEGFADLSYHREREISVIRRLPGQGWQKSCPFQAPKPKEITPDNILEFKENIL